MCGGTAPRLLLVGKQEVKVAHRGTSALMQHLCVREGINRPKSGNRASGAAVREPLGVSANVGLTKSALACAVVQRLM